MKSVMLALIGVLLGACATVIKVKDSDFVNGVRAFPLRPYTVIRQNPDDRDKPFRYYGIKLEQRF
jgi:hypothetical protein